MGFAVLVVTDMDVFIARKFFGYYSPLFGYALLKTLRHFTSFTADRLLPIVVLLHRFSETVFAIMPDKIPTTKVNSLLLFFDTLPNLALSQKLFPKTYSVRPRWATAYQR